MNEHAIVEHGDEGGRSQRAVGIEARRLEADIVALPLPWRQRGINARRRLQIDRAGLPIYIGRILPTVQHLKFELRVQEYSAIATRLPIAI